MFNSCLRSKEYFLNVDSVVLNFGIQKILFYPFAIFMFLIFIVYNCVTFPNYRIRISSLINPNCPKNSPTKLLKRTLSLTLSFKNNTTFTICVYLRATAPTDVSRHRINGLDEIVCLTFIYVIYVTVTMYCVCSTKNMFSIMFHCCLWMMDGSMDDLDGVVHLLNSS